MYDKFLIVGEEFKNVIQAGNVTGFQIGVRLSYYRGIVLSLVDSLDLTVDGETFPPESATVTVGGKTFPLAGLKNEPVAKWEFGEVGILTIHKPGGLKPGTHTLNLREHLNISYVPTGFSGEDTKVIPLVG